MARVFEHKEAEAIISHPSRASLFSGLHTPELSVHNYVMLAFGTPEKRNKSSIESIFAQFEDPTLPRIDFLRWENA